jgi:AcrR family transcriptional regulator
MTVHELRSRHTKYPQAARTLLRDTLLAAASDLLRDYGWAEISMAAIAAHAGVSRQTLYNEFGSREEFAQSFAMREADSFLSAVEATIAQHADDPLQALEAAFEHFLVAAANNPMVRAILLREKGTEDLVAMFTTGGGPVVELATRRLTSAVRKQWPRASEKDARIAVECLVRLAISHAGLPSGSTADAAKSITALIGPFAAQKLGLGPASKRRPAKGVNPGRIARFAR